jgi:hypothetical protein
MRRGLTLLAALAFLSAGCGGEEYQTAQISGRVTLDGKPIEKAAVMFQPVAPKGTMNPGPGSFGITDADGRYTLKLIGLSDRKGAALGHHKVRIENYTEPGDTADDRTNRKPAKPPIPIPERYNRIDAILEFDVLKGGTDEANFELTTKEPPKTGARGK